MPVFSFSIPPQSFNKLMLRLFTISDYAHNVLQEDDREEEKHLELAQKTSPNEDWDDGLTFTAKTSRKYLPNILHLSSTTFLVRVEQQGIA